MKKYLISAIGVVFLFLLSTCKKDPQVSIEHIEIKEDAVEVGTSTVRLGGTLSYPGKIDGLKASVSEEGTQGKPKEYAAALNEGKFSVEITGLKPATAYRYHYCVDYGASSDYETETKSFTTVMLEEPEVKSREVTNVTETTARVQCEVTYGGTSEVTERGVCWSADHDPTLDDDHMVNGSGMGMYVCKLSGLESNTTYYVRAYAKNSSGTGFGEMLTFTTGEASVQIPTVSTDEIFDVTDSTAVCRGTVVGDGGFFVLERGVCWSTSPEPTIDDSHVSNGTGTGNFTVQLSGLATGATYYVRAYAINNYGPGYGEELSFTTVVLADETYIVSGVQFKMIAVEGGTFTMGATLEQGSGASDNEKPTHSVTLSDFRMGETEVTQALWQAVMGNNPSHSLGDNLPVEKVSWNDCQEFISRLNQLCADQLNGRHFSLPTEAEWEYAARGGKQSRGYKYSGSNILNNVAWYTDNSSSTTHVVGTKTPNELGLYDMSGNVFELCQDWYGSYSGSAQTNPTGPATGSSRVGRGGCWYGNAGYCRVSFREDVFPDYKGNFLGLRLALH